MHDGRGAPLPDAIGRVVLDLAGSPIRGLPGPPAEEWSDSGWIELVAACVHHRLLGQLTEAVQQRQWSLGAAQHTHLEQRMMTWLVNALQVERVALRSAEVLQRAGVDFRVVKGVALAHLIYDDPSVRLFSDLDLLVPAQQLDQAVQMLRESLGAVEPVAEVRPGFAREFGKEVMLRVGRVEVDLHRTFVAGPFSGGIDIDELLSERAEVEVGGARLAVLGPNGRILHACYNTALGDHPVRLGSVHDLLRMTSRPDWSPDLVLATATRWLGRAVLQRAASLAVAVGGSDSPGPLHGFAAIAVPRRERWYLHSYLTSARGYTRELAGLAAIPGVRARLRYLRALVRPSDEYLRSRGWTERGHVRRAVQRIGGRNRG